jgi:predicted nucleic acid-binding protein
MIPVVEAEESVMGFSNPAVIIIATLFVLSASLQKSGNPLDDFDLIIAATALAHNLILVTNNTSHFNRIEGLKLSNWAVYPEQSIM